MQASRQANQPNSRDKGTNEEDGERDDHSRKDGRATNQHRSSSTGFCEAKAPVINRRQRREERERGAMNDRGAFFLPLLMQSRNGEAWPTHRWAFHLGDIR